LVFAENSKIVWFTKINDVKENKYFIASLLMTVPAHCKYIAKNNITIKDDDEESVSTLSGNTNDAGLNQRSYNK
jgi:hypothetical protein